MSSNMGCSQNFGPLLDIDYITAQGNQNVTRILETTHKSLGNPNNDRSPHDLLSRLEGQVQAKPWRIRAQSQGLGHWAKG